MAMRSGMSLSAVTTARWPLWGETDRWDLGLTELKGCSHSCL